MANTYKVPELTFSDQAGKRRFGYQTWFKKLRQLLAMFPETSDVIQGVKIVPFKDANCVGNKALYLVIGSRVDAFFQRTIRKLEGKGDQALLFIKNQCASTTADDTHHFHHLFTSICIKENESATNFFKRFTFARTEAEGIGNVYSKLSLVNFALARLSTSKYPKYDTAVQLNNLERDSGKSYSLEDIEKKISSSMKRPAGKLQKLVWLKGMWPWATEGNAVLTVHEIHATLVVTYIEKQQMQMQCWIQTARIVMQTPPVTFAARKGI